MATVELSRAELALLVDALKPVIEEHTVSHDRFSVRYTPTVRAIDAKELFDKLEAAYGPHLRPVA